MEQLLAYIGRDNEERLKLLQNGVPVAEGAVTRAVLKGDNFCIDTLDPEYNNTIYLANNALEVHIRCGLIPGLVSGKMYPCKLTVYDTATELGYAWCKLRIIAIGWPAE